MRAAEIHKIMNNRLRDLRIAKKWTQAELAEQLEVSRQTVNALERGKYDPSLPLAFRIAETFQTRIEEVFHPTPMDSRSCRRMNSVA